MSATANSPERLPDEELFPIRWGWESGQLTRGFTAVLRVKNEALNLPHVLPGLLRCVHHVKVVDNGSTDGTPDVAAEVAASLDSADRLTVVSYPFDVARCGPEHLATPPDSVHSLTRFYQWSFSALTTTFALKWDGDMLLTAEGEGLIRQLSWRLAGTDWVLAMPRHSVYLGEAGRAWVDTEFKNRELWGWPNAPGFTFDKGFDWEIPLHPPDVPKISLPSGICFEIKRLDQDEFDHWSHHEFETTPRTRRKSREVELHTLLGRDEPPEDVIAVDCGSEALLFERLRGLRTPDWQSFAGVDVGAGAAT